MLYFRTEPSFYRTFFIFGANFSNKIKIIISLSEDWIRKLLKLSIFRYFSESQLCINMAIYSIIKHNTHAMKEALMLSFGNIIVFFLLSFTVYGIEIPLYIFEFFFSSSLSFDKYLKEEWGKNKREEERPVYVCVCLRWCREGDEGGGSKRKILWKKDKSATTHPTNKEQNALNHHLSIS